jgi:hypothetical protein
MKNYDPNIIWGMHTIEVTFQQWGYIGHLIFKNGGNCRGKDVLDFDFECSIGGEIKNDCDFRYHEEDDYFSAILKDENGNTLEVEGKTEEFNQMIVKVELIDYVEENEIKGENQ